MPDDQLEQADVVRLNLAVARGIPGLENLDVEKYVRTVDEWTERFRRELPGMERNFKATPHKWKNDIRFFRVGMLQDTKQGTCGNMAALHVAMCRRMGWPVSLACARSHFLSRFDDGQVIHNIEATSTHPGSFASDPDEVYVEKFKLPKRAVECGSDLRKLTAREMIAIFLALRGRHYCDTKRMRLADLDFALSCVLFPNHRRTYVAAMVPMLQRGADIFDRDEIGHPNSLFEDLATRFGFNPFSGFMPAQLSANNNHVFRHRDIHVASVPFSSHTVINGKELKR